MKIICGLGNPDRQYVGSRHNCGFEAIDRIADACGTDVKNLKFKGLTGTCMIGGEKVILVKPQTYMNLSGECLQPLCQFYKVDPTEDLIVLYDDISLPPGHLRIRAKGSAGGHNGMKSLIQCLGTQTFKRVKIGVGEKPAGWDLADWVLGHFSKEDEKVMAEAYDNAAKAAMALVTDDMSLVMNRFNTRKDSVS